MPLRALLNDFTSFIKVELPRRVERAAPARQTGRLSESRERDGGGGGGAAVRVAGGTEAR